MIFNSWFLIANPSAGNKNFKKSWNRIQGTLKKEKINYFFAFSHYYKHEITIVNDALKKGFRKFISVGGDGTLHHIVNAIMKQEDVETSNIKIAVIPTGTGNDWIKTYEIPYHIEKAIKIIKFEFSKLQDIGYLQLDSGEEEFFINLAGIGFDGYVVNQLQSLKRLGSISFLLSGIYSLFFYKNSYYDLTLKKKLKKEKCLMILFGICKFSGGGLRLTKKPKTDDGLIDVTIFKNFSLLDIILNLHKLYNGRILEHKKIENYKLKTIRILQKENKYSFIEADGELVGKGSLKISIVPKAIQFIIPKKGRNLFY